MLEQYNIFDLVFLASCAIFILTAFFRGFVKEIFGLFNLIAALFASYWLSQVISNIFFGGSIAGAISIIALRSIIFFATFFISFLLTRSLCKELKNKLPKSLDSSIGVLFGLTKSIFIFAAIYCVLITSMSLFYNKNINRNSSELPIFLKEAKFLDLISSSSKLIQKPIKLFIYDIFKDLNNSEFRNYNANPLDQKINDVINNSDRDYNKKIKKNIGNLKKIGNIDDKNGYNKKDIDKMNRLIEIIDQ